MWSLQYDTNELIYETETDAQTQKTHCACQRGSRIEEGWTEYLGLADASYYT